MSLFTVLAGCDDEQPPTLDLAPLPATTALSEIVVKGSVYDRGSSRRGLRLQISVNDGAPVAVPFRASLFRHTVALQVGENNILVEAFDGDNNRTAEQVSIYRSDLPQLISVTPESGTITTDESVALTGEFSSAWPYPDTRFSINDTVLEPGDQVNYQADANSAFSVQQPLKLGLNAFKLQVANPDGEAAQFVQIIRQGDSQVDNIALVLAQSEGQLFESEMAALSGTITANVADLTSVAIQFATNRSETVYDVKPLADGSFSTSVALAMGDNLITVVAKHPAGPVATEQLTIKRISQGVFVSVLPTGDEVLEHSPITIEGQIDSDWPVADTLLTINDVSYPLADAGEYYNFSVADQHLALGTNYFTLTVTTPDGARSKLLSLEYKPTADTTAPILELETTGTQTTSPTFSIRGKVTDPGANRTGIASVTITNQAFADASFAATLDGDAFSAEIPLAFGSNTLTVTAEDNSGNQSSLQHTVTRQISASFRSLLPADGALVTSPTITVSGEVVADGGGVIDSILVNERRLAPIATAEAGVYSFSASDIALNIGMNTITVSATGEYVNRVSQQLTIEYRPGDISELDPPTLDVTAPVDGAMLSANSFMVTGRVVSYAGAATITANGVALSQADITSYRLEQAYHAKFGTSLAFADGSNSMIVELVVTDSVGQQVSDSITVYRDGLVPAIQLDDYGPAPAINLVATTSVTLSGLVTDDNISSVTINDQAVSVSPTGTDNQYRFNGRLDVPMGSEQSAVVTAYDIAGNSVSEEYLFQSSVTVGLSALLPPDNAEFLLNGEPLSVQVAARTDVLTDDMRVIAWHGSNDAVVLAQSDTAASGELFLPAVAAEYTLNYAVIDSNDLILAQTSRTVSLIESTQIETALIRHEPIHLAENVEPNQPVELYFNKAIDPAKLTIEVRETLHGETYINADAPGTNFPYARGYTLESVTRDREFVPLSIDVLPGSQTIAIYPKRALGYGASLEVDAQYDGVDIGRFRFNTRALPTFIRGGVSDSFGQPLVGVRVELPELERATTTNGDGAYAFGFQEQGGQEIPSGTYNLIVNGDLTASGLGSERLKTTVEGHRDNKVTMVQLAPLNPAISFVPLQSGASDVSLASGELTIDFSGATLQFPSGYNQGRVHVQFTPLSMLAGKVDIQTPPIWAYAFQPKGVNVEGNVSLSIKMPAMRGGYDYVPDGDAYMLILGFNPQTGVISPIGVGQLDNERNLHSRGTLNLLSLDYISVSWVPMAQQELAAEVAAGQRSLIELTAAISSQFAQ
ncbi:carboxypeptidase-like regulatory domain-containing protein [Corallincola holothuriorum]|nr:carboxypeptidase-like regulatory domain-containing protein [Corallincola holothuriorum]